MQRLFGVSPTTLSGWSKKILKPLDDTITACQPDDILELDELWRYVGCKASRCWLWLALCQRTRLGKLTRRTLSFSKSHTMHQAVIHTFLLNHNEQLSKKWMSL